MKSWVLTGTCVCRCWQLVGGSQRPGELVFCFLFEELPMHLGVALLSVTDERQRPVCKQTRTVNTSKSTKASGPAPTRLTVVSRCDLDSFRLSFSHILQPSEHCCECLAAIICPEAWCRDTQLLSPFLGNMCAEPPEACKCFAIPSFFTAFQYCSRNKQHADEVHALMLGYGATTGQLQWLHSSDLHTGASHCRLCTRMGPHHRREQTAHFRQL